MIFKPKNTNKWEYVEKFYETKAKNTLITCYQTLLLFTFTSRNEVSKFQTQPYYHRKCLITKMQQPLLQSLQNLIGQQKMSKIQHWLFACATRSTVISFKLKDKKSVTIFYQQYPLPQYGIAIVDQNAGHLCLRDLTIRSPPIICNNIAFRKKFLFMK